MSEPMRRLPIESTQPIAVFAVVRLLLALIAAGVVIALGFPYQGRLAAVVAGVAVPWSLFNLVLARRSPERATSSLVAVGDVLMLAAVEAVAPEIYVPVCFMALTFLAVHAHFQGERIGAAVAAFAIVGIGLPVALSDRAPVHDETLALYEAVFAAAAVGAVALVGGFRTAESASRLRARELARHTMAAEREIRRRMSESLHDGPVQELIGLDMTLTAAGREAEREGAGNAATMLGEARQITERTIESLRDEMLNLGPYAYEEFSYEAAVERCLPIWQRRYGLMGRLELERLELPSEMEGELFRITQEAVVNAAKHGHAATVTISLTPHDGTVQLRVVDDGRGFEGVDPLGPTELGHLGLASIRERTELMDGSVSIESSDDGVAVTVTVPHPGRQPRGGDPA